MSTKTTFKRIALVTVAALGFGVMSVVPSNAAINADSLTLSAATASQNTAETVTATSAVATVSFLGAANDSITVTASLVSAPAGNTALPILVLTETASALIDAKTGGTNRALGYTALANTAAAVVAGDQAKVTTAKFAVFMGSGASAGAAGAAAATAPAVAGTYVVRLTPAALGGNALAASTSQTLTITVTAAPALDPVAVTATSIITTAADTTSATDVAVTAIKDASTTADRAVIKVSPLNAAGVAATDSYTALIKSGPGLLSVVSAKNNLAAEAASGRVVAVKSTDWVSVYSDGAAGVTTIEIQSKAGVVLATETLTFYGAATRMTAKALAPVIAATGSTNAVLVNLYDGAIEIKDATTFYVNSDKTTIISGAYTSVSGTYDTTEGGFAVPAATAVTGITNPPSVVSYVPETDVDLLFQ